MRALVAVVLTLLVSPFAAPVASAQLLGAASLVLLVDPPTEPLVPEGAAQTVRGVVEVTSQVPRVGPVIVELRLVQAPAWATVRLPDNVALELRPAGLVWVGEAPFDLAVEASTDAPAFAPEEVVVEGILRGDALQGDAVSEARFPISAAWFSILDVQSPSVVHVPPGGGATVPITLTNFGNGNTKVLFDFVQPTTRVEVGLPAPVTLQSKQSGGTDTSEVVHVRLRAPEDFRDSTKVEIRVTPVYSLDARVRGEEIVVSFVATASAIPERTGAAPSSTTTRGGWNGASMPASSAPAADPSDGSLRVQTAPDSSWELPDGGPSYPFAGALVGGLVGLALARRRLRAA